MATPILRIVTVLAACLLVTCSVGFAVYQYLRSDYQQDVEADIRLHIQEIQNDMRHELGGISSALTFLVDQAELHTEIHDPKAMKRLSLDFLSFVRTSGAYDQIRLIDMSGKELIRANYNGGMPALVPAGKLQNKANRYYFQEGLKLKQGEVYVSPFDLNIEHGEIEQPIKPTIRLVQPAFDDHGKQIGLVVVNVLGAPLLAQIGDQSRIMPVESVSLLNQNGYWLAGPVGDDLWAFMYPERQERNMAVMEPDVWDQIRGHEQARVEADGGIYLSDTFYPARVFGREGLHVERPGERFWKLVVFYPDKFMQEDMIGQFRIVTVASVGSGVALAVILLGMMRLRRQSELRRIAEERGRRQAEENARSQGIVTIAGGMAHEFNNVLTGIIGSAYLLRSELGDRPELYDRVDAIEQQSLRAGELVQLLMAFAQVDLREYSRFSLNQVVSGTVNRMQQSLPGNIHLEASIPDEPLFLLADQDKLEKVLQQLISNAVDAVVDVSQPEIKLTLKLAEGDLGDGGEKEGRYACLTLVDNGCGIAPEDLPKIFDPFFTTKEPGKGTGMGLALVYGVVNALHGGIKVTSNDGRGTTIRICLPLEEAAGG